MASTSEGPLGDERETEAAEELLRAMETYTPIVRGAPSLWLPHAARSPHVTTALLARTRRKQRPDMSPHCVARHRFPTR